MQKIILLASAVALASCAKGAGAIAPASVPNDLYLSFNCDELRERYVNEQNTLAALSSSQKQAAIGDTVGVLLIGVPVSSLSGADKEGAISVSKGKLFAMEQARIKNGCGSFG